MHSALPTLVREPAVFEFLRQQKNDDARSTRGRQPHRCDGIFESKEQDAFRERERCLELGFYEVSHAERRNSVGASEFSAACED